MESHHTTDSETDGRQFAQARDLLDSLKELETDARTKLNIESRMYDTKLPAALYHATTRNNLESITSTGLHPNELMDGSTKVVSLSDTVSFALICASATQDIEASDLVVIEVTTLGQDRDKFRSFLHMTSGELTGNLRPMPSGSSDIPLHEVHYEDAQGISPDFLHVMTQEETRLSIESEES